MRVQYTEELANVSQQAVLLTSKVKEATALASASLFDADIDAAQRVIEGDKDIDALEVKIINECMDLLAKQSPVATDLRVVVSTLRLASLYERMGDLMRHVAETARRAYPDSAVPEQARDVLGEMRDAAEHLSTQVCAMSETHDADVANKIIEGDEVLDNLHKQALGIALADDWKGTAQDTINLVLLSRYYERFGDHAVSAARREIYIVSGFDPSMMPESSGRDVD